MDHAERLFVPLRWWAQGTMLVASLWLAVLAATPEVVAWSVTAVSVALMVAFLVSYGRARVAVEGGELHAGRAHIPLGLVGAVDVLDADAVRRLAGVDADARAHLLLRPYLKRGVRAEITDPADPAPYWLITCRRPDALAAAVEASRTSSRPAS